MRAVQVLNRLIKESVGMRPKLLEKFLNLESASGIILFVMAILAMLLANSPLAFIHQQFVDASLFWVNEGLMALFFLLVGLELKRGYLEGQFSHFSQVILPLIGALGGMIIPALIYIFINIHDPVTLKGWATPVATDIAFALGVLTLLGKRIPISLKLFLLALAIFDDIGAIIIISVFYAHGLSLLWLCAALLLVAALFLLNRLDNKWLSLYLIIGAGLWYALLKAGIHPTISGVLLALFLPDGKPKTQSPLHRLEHALHPYVAYFIMPLFALVNAGFSFTGMTADILFSQVVLGITLGLFVGKQLGVFGFASLLIKLGFAKLPDNTSWAQLYGIAILCGIGFTMSLFLGTLSFQNEPLYLAEVRLGVILGSILSSMAGAFVLIAVSANKKKKGLKH